MPPTSRGTGPRSVPLSYPRPRSVDAGGAHVAPYHWVLQTPQTDRALHDCHVGFCVAFGQPGFNLGHCLRCGATGTALQARYGRTRLHRRDGRATGPSEMTDVSAIVVGPQRAPSSCAPGVPIVSQRADRSGAFGRDTTHRRQRCDCVSTWSLRHLSSSVRHPNHSTHGGVSCV